MQEIYVSLQCFLKMFCDAAGGSDDAGGCDRRDGNGGGRRKKGENKRRERERGNEIKNKNWAEIKGNKEKFVLYYFYLTWMPCQQKN